MPKKNNEKEKKPHILIIDDEPDFLFAIEAWMLAKGFSVTTAEGGKKGLEVFTREHPDLIFIDILMPEMDGVDTLKAIRKIDEKVPIILITAFGLSKRVEEAEKYGVYGFFRKSHDFEQAATLIYDAVKTIEKDKG